ncbi:DNA-directed RNA polymerase subunit delta [Bacillus massilinigeriensis]|uniref:DNA-directed RNA polymerase subunit delta n=1 Tax=Bacillus massilionigeriensis TaxID=1805475 RepID=UPI00096B0BC2|nr:DNA-directed RNA polymerase subunit delta [Bacillus massilionigeriensis]
MSLEKYSTEQLQEMSFIEICYEMLEGNKQPVSFSEIMEEIKKILNLSDEEVRAKIAQFYTDLNIDGRFIALGENRWGLRVWYPVDQIEDEVVAPVKSKKKKAKKVVEDEEEQVEDFDDLDEEELDIDETEEFDDEEDSDDDLLTDDLDEEDEDEDLLEEDEFDLDDEDLDDEELDLDEEDEDR